MRFVYGGIFLPWQNPASALLTVASALDEEKRGFLEVIGGRHPFHAVDTGSFGPLVDKLAQMPRVRMSGLLPHDKLVERYVQAHVAVDMMMPNAERELAFPSRTVHYMWCGLPVIHAAFSEVAEYIRDWEAGWVVPHDDPEALREVVRSVLANPGEARRRGLNAQRLVRERFSWDRTIEGLDRFVRQPYIRSGRGERSREKRDQIAIGQSSAYLLKSANGIGSALPPRLQKLAAKRRTLPAQLMAKSSALARAIAPVAGGRARPSIIHGRPRFALPELIAGHSHGQRFLCPHNGLSGLRIEVHTFGRRNTCRLALHIRSNPGATQDLHSLEVPMYQLRNDQVIAFRFPPIKDAANKWFYFVAESPDGAPGDAVTLWATMQPRGNANLQRYEDGLPAPGSLVLSLEFDGAT